MARFVNETESQMNGPDGVNHPNRGGGEISRFSSMTSTLPADMTYDCRHGNLLSKKRRCFHPRPDQGNCPLLKMVNTVLVVMNVRRGVDERLMIAACDKPVNLDFLCASRPAGKLMGPETE